MKKWRTVSTAKLVQRMRLLAGTQAVEFLAPLRPGNGVCAVHDFVRSLSARLDEDRSLSSDIERVAAAIRSGEVLAPVEEEIGALA